MTVQELLSIARFQLNDKDTVNPEYPDGELVNYLNLILKNLSVALATLNYKRQLKTVEIQTDNDGKYQLPDDFIREFKVFDTDGRTELISSTSPRSIESGHYSIEGDYIYFPESNETYYLSYYFSFPSVTVDSTMPLPDWQCGYVIESLVFWALNRNEFSLSVENSQIKEMALLIATTDGTGQEKIASSGLPF